MAVESATVSAPTTTRCCWSGDHCGRLGARGPLCGRLSPGRLSRPPRMSIRVAVLRPQRDGWRRRRRRQRERRWQQQRSHTADGATVYSERQQWTRRKCTRTTPLRFRVVLLAGVQKRKTTHKTTGGRYHRLARRPCWSRRLFPLSRTAPPRTVCNTTVLTCSSRALIKWINKTSSRLIDHRCAGRNNYELTILLSYLEALLMYTIKLRCNMLWY